MVKNCPLSRRLVRKTGVRKRTEGGLAVPSRTPAAQFCSPKNNPCETREDFRRRSNALYRPVIYRSVKPLHLTAAYSAASYALTPVSYTHLDVYKRQIMRHEAKEKQRGRKKITIAVLVSIALCIIAIFAALFLLPINIAYEPVKIDFPFEVEDVESVEMYHYDGVPALSLIHI